jgi:hypothetical protein
VCVLGIAGMIAASIADNNGAALTAGLVTATAVLCLIVATAVTAPARTAQPAGHDDDSVEALAADVERSITAAVASGGDEGAVRSLAGAAVRLGQARAAR